MATWMVVAVIGWALALTLLVLLLRAGAEGRRPMTGDTDGEWEMEGPDDL